MKNGKSWEIPDREMEVRKIKNSIFCYQALVYFFQFVCIVLIVVIASLAWKKAPSLGMGDSLELINNIRFLLLHSIVALSFAFLSSLFLIKNQKRLISLLEKPKTHKQEIDEVNKWLDGLNETEIK